jgi:hypothetical protein
MVVVLVEEMNTHAPGLIAVAVLGEAKKVFMTG